MNYAFYLEFSDLDEELQERLINDYIEFHRANGDWEGMNDEEIEDSARRSIEARFPIYF